MKLMYAPPSPFARKARVAAIEKGLQDRVEFVLVNPMNDDPTLLAANPVSKIPALELDNGSSIIDSALICSYLDTLSDTNPLFSSGEEHWEIQRVNYLANSILDAAVAARMEWFRPEEIRWQPWVDRQHAAITRGLVELEKAAGDFSSQVTMAQITTAVMLESLDFRLPETNWRDNHPTLAAWLPGFSSRESMQQTQPPAS